MSPNPELESQIECERREIENAPVVHYGPSVPTCHFCGRILRHEERTLVESLKHENGLVHERFMGGCCGRNTA